METAFSHYKYMGKFLDAQGQLPPPPSSLIHLHISNVQTMVYGDRNTTMSHITESTFQFSK